ncbi:zeta toxin family protein [Rhodococcus coprophilus]|uniref:zeta toxin family protein n=1 Tax=Rhodococcus coprophilus TaxID=38310 RepID=UPI0037B10BB2
MADLQAKTAVVLERMCASGGTLDRDGATASHRLYANDPHRRRTVDRIIESYLAEQRDIAFDGHFCAVATAGVPGAGKSTSIQRHGLAGLGWRILDADRIKDHLIRDALDTGVYRSVLDLSLPDGGTVMPRELATLVHTESTKILDALQDLCLQRGENIVIEGTFSWPGLGERLLRKLGAAGYERFTIMDVEVPLERAQTQALQRRWGGRQRVDNGLGGRFTPAAVIAALYPDTGSETICAANARATFDHPLTAEIRSVELLVDDYTSGELVQRISTRSDGVISYESAGEHSEK